MKTIYLDFAATTPVRKEVLLAMKNYFSKDFANPSSIHSFGRRAKEALENARSQVASFLFATPEEIVFTSSGTEANNLALVGSIKKGHLMVSSIEHPSVLKTAKALEKRGFLVTYLPVDRFGRVDPKRVLQELREDTSLISIMHANNEIGTIQPIEEISLLVKQKAPHVLIHTDAVQTAGVLPIDVQKLGIDLLSLSSHKLYGPKGAGALFVKKGVKLSPLLYGGGQERTLRPSTENIPAIIGFAKACSLAKQEQPNTHAHLLFLKNYLKEGLLTIPNLTINGDELSAPHILNVSIAYVEGESILLSLDEKGICVSTGSACSSKNLEPSHVLLACGLPIELAHGSIRFSLGKTTTKKEIERVLSIFPKIVKKLRDLSPFTPV